MKRYDLKCEISDGQAWMEKAVDGEYVKFEDLKAVEEQRDELEEQRDELEEQRDELKNDLDSLRSDIRELLQYVIVADGPAFEGRDALDRIKGVL